LDSTVFQPTDCTLADSEIETLKPYRVAQVFEIVRYKTDVYAQSNKRPLVFKRRKSC
jgi:methylmalonyl-CoA mutase